MLELLWFLLPVAAASGWWMARRQTPRRGEKNTAELFPDYFKGLNYLINEQPDKAIEVFVKMLEVDSETVETHLALGVLFRRRGEVDRAIRIHQNLIARPALSKEQRSQALLELGLDYMRAGLLDRAENLFLDYIGIHGEGVAALRALCDIYQQEKDWNKAIAMAQRLEEATGKRLNAVIAQYYCELAEQARQHHDDSQAMQMVKRALSSDPACVRATILQGDMEREGGHCKSALKTYKGVEMQDADFLPEIMPAIIDCYRTLGKTDEMIDYLKQIAQKHDGLASVRALSEILRYRQGERDAMAFVMEQLNRRPTLAGVISLVDLYIADDKEDTNENLVVIKNMLEKIQEQKSLYRCNHCGFSGRSIHWQCPGCKSWGSVKPVQGMGSADA